MYLNPIHFNYKCS